MKYLYRLVLIGLSILVISCGNNEATLVGEYVAPPSGIVAEYHIGVDDVLSINVWKNPDLNVSVPVRPDGKISVPLVGDAEAGGRTPEEVSKIVRKKLSKFIRDPQVTVIVTNLRSHEYLARLRVTGAVLRPISIQFRQGMTVLDAVLAAGGVNSFAAANRTKLYRKENGKTVIISIYLDDILYEGDLETNILLTSGDIITVPERLF